MISPWAECSLTTLEEEAVWWRKGYGLSLHDSSNHPSPHNKGICTPESGECTASFRPSNKSCTNVNTTWILSSLQPSPFMGQDYCKSTISTCSKWRFRRECSLPHREFGDQFFYFSRTLCPWKTWLRGLAIEFHFTGVWALSKTRTKLFHCQDGNLSNRSKRKERKHFLCMSLSCWSLAFCWPLVVI